MEETVQPHNNITGSPLRGPEAVHGPCYVLCPLAYATGRRVVIRTIPARNTPQKKTRSAASQTASAGLPVRRIATWPEGRPHDWRIVSVPVKKKEPRWAKRARELRASGWSIRRIMKELGVNSRRHLAEVLYEYTV